MLNESVKVDDEAYRGWFPLWKSIHNENVDEAQEDREWFPLHKSVGKEEVDDEVQEERRWFHFGRMFTTRRLMMKRRRTIHKSVRQGKVDDEAQEDHGLFPHLEEYSREG